MELSEKIKIKKILDKLDVCNDELREIFNDIETFKKSHIDELIESDDEQVKDLVERMEESGEETLKIIMV